MLTLHSESLRTAFQQSVTLFTRFFHYSDAGFLCLFNVSADLNIVLLKLLLNQFKVLIETVPKFKQALIDLGLDFLLQTIAKNLVALLSVLVSIEDCILQVSDLRLNGVFEELAFCTNLVCPITPVIGTFADLIVELFNRLVNFR